MAIYGIDDVAELVGVTYRQLWYALRVGDLKQGRRIGRMRVFDEIEVAEIKRYFSTGNGAESNPPSAEKSEER